MNHNFTAETLHSIGKVYAHKGDLKESLIYYEEALPIFQDVLGKQNEKTLGIIKDIIRCYEESGDTDRAAEYKARLKEQDS
jgi:tetratricopeptide (TPR) repeat protein